MTGVHMIFRTMLHALISRFGPRLGHWDVARTKFRVLPTDLDILKHMNNGVYLSIADIGRFDLLHAQRGVGDLQEARLVPGRRVGDDLVPQVAGAVAAVRRRVAHPRLRREGGVRRAAVHRRRRDLHAGVHPRPVPQARRRSRHRSTNCWRRSARRRRTSPFPQWLLEWGADAALPSTRAEAPSVWAD